MNKNADAHKEGAFVIASPWNRFAGLCGLVCLALSLTACVVRQPAVPDPSREARLVRSMVEDLKAGSSADSCADSGSRVGGGRLVALSSARVTAFSPSREPALADADADWFMEPSLHNVVVRCLVLEAAKE